MNCTQCKSPFQIANNAKALHKKLNMPESSMCPDCILQRKLAFRNERSLYQSKCDLTGKKTISMYRPGAGYTVYDPDVWWGDKWKALDYGKEFDFNQPFFDQFNELFKKVPKCNLYNFDHENSDYCNVTCHNKNCYLIFGSWFDENCMYGNTLIHSHNCIDNFIIEKCEYCYELIDCNGCYELFFSQLCENCSESLFLYNCRNCKNCIGCTNLIDKENYLFNEKSTKEEIGKIKKELNRKSINELKEKFDKIKKESIHKFMTGVNNQDVTGDFVYNCKTVHDSYVVYDCEDVCHGFRVTKNQKDSIYIMGCSGGELIYDSLNADFCHRSNFLLNGEHNSDCYYCTNCYNLKNCFGCDGLRHKKYCILNKQYSKEEYEELLPKIIEYMQSTREWGQFFPVEISPFAYNETVAQDYFPLIKEDVTSKGWVWSDYEQEVKADKRIPGSRLPDNIKDVPDDILNWAIECEVTEKPFKIVEQELKFYRKYNLPVPQLHPDQRHLDRMLLRNPMKLYDRKCMKCQSDIRTTYAPNREEKVYCEECYLETVY